MMARNLIRIIPIFFILGNVYAQSFCTEKAKSSICSSGEKRIAEGLNGFGDYPKKFNKNTEFYTGLEEYLKSLPSEQM